MFQKSVFFFHFLNPGRKTTLESKWVPSRSRGTAQGLFVMEKIVNVTVIKSRNIVRAAIEAGGAPGQQHPAIH
jgi:hypothetical protein